MPGNIGNPDNLSGWQSRPDSVDNTENTTSGESIPPYGGCNRPAADIVDLPKV